MAILSLSSYSPWSEDIADMETRNFGNLVHTLKSSSQLTEVRLLPSLLVPEKRTVPYLREASARIQADLLFVYTARIQSFRRDRFMKPDEVRAQCVAESVLLDVRTGIVIHTARATENIAMKKAPTDLNFSETIAAPNLTLAEKLCLRWQTRWWLTWRKKQNRKRSQPILRAFLRGSLSPW
jgi:hypothetical protein